VLVPGVYTLFKLYWSVADVLLSQILKPAEKKQKYVYGGGASTPPRKQKKK
jgi:hypothetical protein